MVKTLQWGVIGTGNIAKAFARALPHSRTGRLLAVGSRTQEKADAFGKEFNVPRCYGSYPALLADAEVQAVYVCTPHPHHAEWAIKSAEAGKHILCEKPLTINHPEAMAVVEAACRHDVFLMEAFMYRCHPQIAKVIELIRQQAIGQVRVIRATFSFHAGFNPESRLFKNALGGGGILDVGCYAVSMARLVAGAASGRDFAEPLEVEGCGHLGATGVDEWAIAALKFPGDILAQLATGVALGQDSTVHVFGSEGNLLVPTPWIPTREGGATKIILKLNREKEAREILIETKEFLYALEADVVADSLPARQACPPAMTWDDTLGNMRTLDLWRQSIGLVYDAEKPQAQTTTVHKRPLAAGKDSKMQYGSIPGLDKQVARLVMGADNQRTFAHAGVMFDDYFERGGNCFDTAYVYSTEGTVGQWVRNRNVRDQVVVLDKGAHTPFCTPKDLTRQLFESLDRLGLDYVDIYMMHRDNPEVPAGEFVDVLNEHVRAGRMRAFGASNWTRERVEAFNACAKSKGLSGMAAISNNFSLARMVEAPWQGCLPCSDEKWRAWLTETQMPVMPWSSQARGFFTERARPDDRSDAELVRCWYSDDNFQRQARAMDLAGKYGVPAIAIALAYVLHQPFPTFPLIGPRTLAETRTSFLALEVKLTPDQVRWLNLQT